MIIPFTLAFGCGDTGTGGTGGTGDAQTPPTGAASVTEWLAGGAYETWACEPSVHAARSPSPHGFNRICSNAAIADNVEGTGPWPQGAAAVKELYDNIAAPSPIGFAVYLKLDADSGGGDNWYWFEAVRGDVAADGLGTRGTPRDVCVGCHQGAGTDAAHTPIPGARDQVYSPIAI